MGKVARHNAGGAAGNFSLAFFSLFQVPLLSTVTWRHYPVLSSFVKNNVLACHDAREHCNSGRKSLSYCLQVSTGDGWAWAIARPLIGNIYPNLLSTTIPINSTEHTRSGAGPTLPGTADPTIRRPVT